MYRALALLACSIFCIGQAITFTHSQYPTQGQPVTQADLNGDGILDIVSVGWSDAANQNGFWVTLSNSDGSYQPPVFYHSPYTTGGTASVVLGDFNNDGKVDVAQVEQTTDVYIYLNNGNGTLSAPHGIRISDSTMAFNLTAADLNRDGRLDLVVLDNTNGVQYLRIMNGDGTGNFTLSSSVQSTQLADTLFVGDFDGDGKADIATTWAHCDRGAGCATFVQVFWGNGTGGFSQVTQTDYTIDYYFSEAIDVNQDGKTDLVGHAGASSSIRMLFGSDSRSWTVKDVALSGGIIDQAVADFNGDGINDLAVLENVNGTQEIGIKTGSADGTYAPEQYVYNGSSVPLEGLMAGRYDRDRQADLVVKNETDGSFNGSGDFVFLHNTTGGSTPSCAPPNSARGIVICAPTTNSDGSTHIQVGAAFTSPLRKTEIWVDGVKKAQSFYAYATYAFLDTIVSLASGSHTIDAYAVTYDGRVEKASLTFTAGSAGGGGGSCSAPSSPGAVHICSPIYGSTVDSPVTFQARGGSAVNYLEAWLDGQKIGYWRGPAGTVSFTISKSLAAGSHRFVVIAETEPTITDSQQSTFTVSSGSTGSCEEATNSGSVNVCSPVNGSTVSSPVTFSAHGGAAVNYLEAWLDGVKVGYWRGTPGSVQFNYSQSLPAGSHRFTVIAETEPDVTDKVVVYFTVQ